MERRSRKQIRPSFDGRKTSSPRLLPKRISSPAPIPKKLATVFWSNSAYVPDDECSSVGSKKGGNDDGPILLPPTGPRRRTHLTPLATTQIINEEERRLREELGKEIEKELERELMEGILVLVRRLSELKAKQIAHGPKHLWCSDYPVHCEEYQAAPHLDAFSVTQGRCRGKQRR